MAAPPLPPKSGSASWLKDNRVDNHGAFLSTGPSTIPAQHTTFSPSTSCNENAQGEPRVPPIPPRPIRMWNYKANDQLSAVPPPPSIGQVLKMPNFNSLPARNVNANFISTTTTMVNGNFLTNFNSQSVAVPPFPNRTVTTNHIFATNLRMQNSQVFSMSPTSLSFMNTSYQFTPPVPSSATNNFDIHHSKSAPDLINYKQTTLPIHRSSIPNVIQVPPRTYLMQQQPLLQKDVSSQASLEGVLKFMKKKRDSNLIDLYCTQNESLDMKYRDNKKSHLDDILKLFDPLCESLEESVVAEVDEGTTFATPVETVPKEVQSSISKQEKPNPAKSDETIYAKIEFKRPLSDSTLRIVKSGMKCSQEMYCFCDKLRKLRSEFLHDDHPTNVGVVISSVLDSYQEEALSIQLVIYSSYSERPVSFTCDVNTSVEHIISHAVCTVLDDASSLSMDDFLLKVFGLCEFFSAHSALVDYEYVHQCHKFDKPVLLTLIHVSKLDRIFSRTHMDDVNDVDFDVSDIALAQKRKTINYEALSILIETLEREIEKIKASALKLKGGDLCPQGVVQAVKAICTLLSHVETAEITDVVSSLIDICLLFGKSETSSFEVPLECSQADNCDKLLQRLFPLLEFNLQKIHQAIHRLLILYTKTFSVDFEVDSAKKNSEFKSVCDFLDVLLLQLNVVHSLPANSWAQFESFTITIDLSYGNKTLASISSKSATVSKSFFPCLLFDEWLQFETYPMCTLPRESILYFTVWGIESNQSDGSPPSKTLLGWCGMRLFDHDDEIMQGSLLLGLWPADVSRNSGPLLSNPSSSMPLLQVSLPEFDCVIKFPVVVDNKFSSFQKRNFEDLESNIQTTLMEIINKDVLTTLQPDERELLWEKRHYLHKFPHALPKVLLSAHGWDWACLSDIYSLLKSWNPLTPVDSLQLLLSFFPDRKVREIAIQWMKNIVSDELCDYLPQVIQALRYEAFDDSATAWFLLERSLTSVRVAHHMYWLLKQNVSDPVCGWRMQHLLNALLITTGEAMRKSVNNQETLLDNLSDLAEKIKTAKESLRLNIVLHELEITHHALVDKPTCLPLSPSLKVCGVDVKCCSYYTSNTLPLKITFRIPEKGAKTYEAIYKVGDDLRQDMITLQMIRIMDKLWLKNGLDLKIVTFMCVATDYKKGMVELVPESETLRKIQTELGLTGSFKDRSISEWLQKYNTSELEYQQAVENFTLSCAGYCVATYILGICDRHNDNIMLKTSGHLFHIDFGKFLGDAQMFGNIKRDRTPFVLTSDMAYVINGGDKPSKKFQYFIDLCCQAFNIVREHSSIFFNLFSLMVESGITGLSHNAVAYIQNALLPNLSEAEATAQFTRMIQESLKSWFTQFNFFIHNLAQLRFTGDHNDDRLLSFIPKVYTREVEGQITEASVIGYKKMYDTEKYYMYIISIERKNHQLSSCVFRTYREFIEFRQKLCMLFPLAKLHPLPGNPLVGRTNVRDVSNRRKGELKVFLSSLFRMTEEIAHCDLVYTFFHPMLRDQEGMVDSREAKMAQTRARRGSSVSQTYGQIKLSIVYKNNSLFIMIMHAKNLNSPRGNVPDPYVKSYLVPDPNKLTKRKTKIIYRNCHPTFMEMLVYALPFDVVRTRTLYISVWDYDRVQENEFMGAALIPLSDGNIHVESAKWYQLGSIMHH